MFISYAQNFEDVMLWRALKHIKNGFYVDIGAYSPTSDSVTKHFYDIGWHGINVEPNPNLIKQFQEERPNDIILEIAISDTNGSELMFFVSNAGLSSLDKTIAEGHQSLGYTTTEKLVALKTLATIFDEHLNGNEIHFLKIDVEGFEYKALLGNNWNKYRPWVLVIEATLPMSQIENYDEWEPFLKNQNYTFVYADGLNRFYLADEHKELSDAFKYPPNVFDGFRAAEHHNAALQVQALTEQEKHLRLTLKEMEEDLIQQKNALILCREHEEQLRLVLESTSWKVTAPFRKISNLLVRLSASLHSIFRS